MKFIIAIALVAGISGGYTDISKNQIKCSKYYNMCPADKVCVQKIVDDAVQVANC